VDQELNRNVIVERAFWAACAMAIVAGVGPLLVAAGHTNRIAGVILPFAAAAVALAIAALTYRRGTSITALVYFVSGLAIAYGMLLVLAVPLRLAVLGSCPPAPARCASGLELQLSTVENTGLTVAVIFGVLALFTGFVGLTVLYRRLGSSAAQPRQHSVWPAQPPPKAAPTLAETGSRPAATKEEHPVSEAADKQDEPPPS